ncbi:MAG TPA: DNA-primase RepB domain-containing protein [Caldilineaceae bacterium]|nr:DNA-primase RepB domain-containing protein [Caldilineaceae bacterium]
MTTRSSLDTTPLSGGEATRLRTDTERLLMLLHRGGNYAHLWTDAGNRSFWFPISTDPEMVQLHDQSTHHKPTQHTPHKLAQHTPRHVPKQWLRHNVYFSVHPLSEIPPQNMTGVTDPRFISSQTAYICAVNALFAEFDGKDYVYTRDYQSQLPARLQELSAVEQQQAVKAAQETVFYQQMAPYKARALRHIAALPFPPSVIIDSGGGYHCYWLLRQTVPIDDTNRDDVQLVQHRWVQLVGGDRGAADLRRVRRLPGTYNHKPGLGDPHRVVFLRSDFGLLYDYRALEEAVLDWHYEQERRRKQFRHRYRRQRRRAEAPTAEEQTALNSESAIRRHFNETHPIADLLLRHGYQRSGTGRGITRFSRPGRHRRNSSITIFSGETAGRTERSIHFSTNDPLYSSEYIDRESGTVRRHLNDAFHIYVMLEHSGDWAAAYEAAAKGTTAKNTEETGVEHLSQA